MSNYVFVIDTNHKPLTPCTPGVARSLLKSGQAAVFRRYPFTIVLKKEVQETPNHLALKLDPGSKITGIALLKDSQLIWAAELTHRGSAIKDALLSRRQLRQGRRKRLSQMARKSVFMLGASRYDRVEASISQRRTVLSKALATDTAHQFTKRMDTIMLHRPCLLFPPDTKPGTAIVRVSKGEER